MSGTTIRFASLLALCLANVVIFICGPRLRERSSMLLGWSRTSFSYLGEDYPELLVLRGHDAESNERRVSLQVEHSVHFSLDREDGESIWRASTPNGGGYVHLGGDMRLYSIAMFHQLHCIERLREALNGEGDAHHPQHCLSYLRQFILCQPDLTLESDDFIKTNFNSKEENARVGTTHTCGDWSAVYEAVEGNWDDWVAAANSAK